MDLVERSSTRRLWSVSIGIDRYADPLIAPLSHAVDDAVAFDRGVRSISPRDRVQSILLTDGKATVRSIRTSIGEDIAGGAAENDVVIIFFAGHGSPETSTGIDEVSRYLVLHDTAYESIFATALDLERDFVHLLERIKARTIVVFIDACFSGAAGGRTFEGPSLHHSRRALRHGRLAFEDLELGAGRVIISACDDGQVAQESDSLSHGVFTYCLLQRLTARSDDEQTVSVPQLYDEVATEVARRTAGQQHPVLNGRARLLRVPVFRSGA